MLFLLSVLLFGTAGAQVKFYTQLSSGRLSVAHSFQLQYIVEGSKDVNDLDIPALTHFRVLEIFENRAVTVDPSSGSRDVYARILVLAPLEPGKFTIPGARAHINGQWMRSNDLQVEVGSNGATQQYDRLSMGEIVEENSILRPGDLLKERMHDGLILRVEVNKRSCYVGECLQVNYKLYSRLNSNSQVLRRPSFTGFSVMEMVDTYNSNPDIELLNGQPYYVNLIRKVQLFPLQQGRFFLDPAEVESTVHFIKTNARSGSGSFQPSTPYEYTTTLKTDPVEIEVKPLPLVNKPVNYSGAIGQFSVHSAVLADEVHAGDLVKVQIQLEGTGNIPLLTAPLIEWPSAVDTTDPSVKEETNRYVFPLHGKKIFEYTFMSPDTGTYAIPAVHFPYYDPLQEAYRIAACDSITIHVLPARITETKIAQEEMPGQTGRRRQYFWFGLIVIAILLWIIYQWRLDVKEHAAKANIPDTETEKKNAIEVPLFDRAQEELDKGDLTAFYEILQQTIWKQLAEKYKLPPAEQNRQQLLVLKNQYPERATLLSKLSVVLQECEWALYMPGYQGSSPEDLLSEARSCLDDSGYIIA